MTSLRTVTIASPLKMNAMTATLHRECSEVWKDVDADPSVSSIIITGSDKAFSAGGDLKGMAQRVGTRDNFRHTLRAPGNTRRLWQNMVELNAPVVAAINGDAAGFGCSLALFCDITVMAETRLIRAGATASLKALRS